MRVVPLPYPKGLPGPLIDEWCARHELTKTEIRLAGRPGALHWHLSSPGQRGTLEVTHEPKREEFFLSVHGNREGDWVEGVIRDLVESTSSVRDE